MADYRQRWEEYKRLRVFFLFSTLLCLPLLFILGFAGNVFAALSIWSAIGSV
jgi:hypothetical protein